LLLVPVTVPFTKDSQSNLSGREKPSGSRAVLCVDPKLFFLDPNPDPTPKICSLPPHQMICLKIVLWLLKRRTYQRELVFTAHLRLYTGYGTLSLDYPI
jgi:hypothetical protein